jgi:hypothetical protein
VDSTPAMVPESAPIDSVQEGHPMAQEATLSVEAKKTVEEKPVEKPAEAETDVAQSPAKPAEDKSVVIRIQGNKSGVKSAAVQQKMILEPIFIVQ